MDRTVHIHTTVKEKTPATTFLCECDTIPHKAAFLPELSEVAKRCARITPPTRITLLSLEVILFYSSGGQPLGIL